MPRRSTSPYRYYYSQLFTKMKHGGRLELFKERREQADNEVTLEAICNELVIYGTPDKVADDILAFRETVGDFGTLLYAGKDWAGSRIGPSIDGSAGRKSAAEGQRRDRKVPLNALKRCSLCAACRAGVTAL